MNEDEKILNKLKKLFGEDTIDSMSPSDLKSLIEHPEVWKQFVEPDIEEVAPKGFEDYCPDIMKNPVTAQLIEKEGDKARVFAVKMAGIADNPKVSAELKQMIASPEGLVDLYHRVDVKAAYEENLVRRYMQNQESVEELQKLEEKLRDPKNSVCRILIINDKTVYNPVKHWEQCYSMGKSSGKETLEVLTEEARDYHQKAVVLAEKKAAMEALAKLKGQDKDKTSPTKAKKTVHKLTVSQVHSVVEEHQYR